MDTESASGNAAFTTNDIERAISLLARDDVRRLLNHSSSSILTPDQIEDLPVPQGMSRQHAIDLVTAIERTGATYSPIADDEGRLYWFVCRGGTRTTLSRIDRFCTTDSLLFQTTTSRTGARFLVQSNVDETLATAMLDGIHMDLDAGKEMLLMQRQARTREERLIINQFGLTDDLPDLAGAVWSPEILVELYARLTNGLPRRETRNGDGWSQSRDILGGLCAYANRPSQERCEHPAIRALILRGVVANLRPFPAFNGMMSRLIFRMYSHKRDYPVLGYIPISNSELRLAEYRKQSPDPQPSSSDFLERYHEANATTWVGQQVALFGHALEQFRARMERADVIDLAVQHELHADDTLNHRQRAIIGRALRIPGATFRIGYHRTAHDIGYATAHRDFASLVESGYLVEDYQGRMKLFRAGPKLDQRIGALTDVGRVEDYDVPLPAELLSHNGSPGE